MEDEEYDAEDAPDFDNMTYEEFLFWLYENRNMFLEEDADFDITPDQTEVVPVDSYEWKKSNKGYFTSLVVADRFGPFLCFRN